MEESGTEEAKCSRKVASVRRVASAIKSLVNARDFQLECATVLHETLLVPVLMNGSETMSSKEKERSRIRALQMNIFRGLLGIRRMDRVPNTRISELCGLTKRLDKRIHEGVLSWFSHVERMENDRIAKRVYVGRCADSRSLGRQRKRGINTTKEKEKEVWMSGQQREWGRIGVNDRDL